MRPETQRTVLLALVLSLAAVHSPLHAWSQETQLALAQRAAAVAPPDLARQIERHKARFREGVIEAFWDEPAAHLPAAAGGRLEAVIADLMNGTAAAIRGHTPFDEVAFRLGVLSHFVADANNPLAAADGDREEGRYTEDFLRYVASTGPRVRVAFYGNGRRVDRSDQIAPWLAATLARSGSLYPMVGREYRRIGFGSGVARFDDRSSAFGVAALSASHAASDIFAALRYVWLTAGGADERRRVRLTPPATLGAAR